MFLKVDDESSLEQSIRGKTLASPADFGSEARSMLSRTLKVFRDDSTDDQFQ